MVCPVCFHPILAVGRLPHLGRAGGSPVCHSSAAPLKWEAPLAVEARVCTKLWRVDQAIRLTGLIYAAALAYPPYRKSAVHPSSVLFWHFRLL